jgi:hypothetical protein
VSSSPSLRRIMLQKITIPTRASSPKQGYPVSPNSSSWQSPSASKFLGKPSLCPPKRSANSRPCAVIRLPRHLFLRRKDRQDHGCKTGSVVRPSHNWQVCARYLGCCLLVGLLVGSEIEISCGLKADENKPQYQKKQSESLWKESKV